MYLLGSVLAVTVVPGPDIYIIVAAVSSMMRYYMQLSVCRISPVLA
jgi:hypothetical protein